MRGHFVSSSCVRGNFTLIPRIAFYDRHGTAMIKLLKCYQLVRYQKIFLINSSAET